jgi:enoyl-CoA hydratase
LNAFQTIAFEKRDSIAWLTLDRPDVLNAMNMHMRDELWTAMHAVRDDPDVRVLIIKGAGDQAFSAGADVSEFGTAPSYVEARRARRERDLWQFMLDLDKPLIAAIHGYALGAGCEMSMCCDLRIASEDARFGLPEVKLAYIPSAGGTQLLPRTIALGVAMEMVLTGDDIDAATALRLGLVHKVVPRERLYDEAEAWARRLIECSPVALRYAKEAVTRGLEMRLEEGLAIERRLARLLSA